MSQDMIVPISAVVSRIKTIVSNIEVHKIWIQGEVSNLTKHRSGHYYFSIKDNYAELSCVMFSSYVNKLTFSLEEGMKVLVKGSLNVYEQRGNLQLYIRTIKQDGMGELFLEFEKRKEMLFKQGYFEDSHKTIKPDFIENIGLITAKEGAALHDVMSTIQRRWPMLKVTLYPAYVQGSFAPASLIKQLKKADQNDHDAILIVRGGGSFEDLFCFNDVELVKTIYHAKTYIVSGVGHEVDTTLCDLVSDHRSVTPTAAAQWVTNDQYDVLNEIQNKQDLLINQMRHILDVNQTRYLNISANPYMQDPKLWIKQKQLALENLESRLDKHKEMFSNQQNKIEELKKSMYHAFNQKLINASHYREDKHKEMIHAIELYHMVVKKHLKENESLLDAYSPLKVLTRGYSITNNNEHVIRSVNEVNEGDMIFTRLSDGTITSKIIKKEKQNG